MRASRGHAAGECSHCCCASACWGWICRCRHSLTKHKVGGGIAAPTFSAALTDGELTITLTGAEGADIYYTTDETEPTASSTKYEAPFAVTDNTKATTIKAAAVSGSTTGAVMIARCGYAGAGETNKYGKISYGHWMERAHWKPVEMVI